MNIVTPSYLTAPDFHEPDAELRSLRIEMANTDPEDTTEQSRLDARIRTRLLELHR